MTSAFLEFLQAVKAEEKVDTKLRQLHFRIGERFVQCILVYTSVYICVYYLVLIYICMCVRTYVRMYVCSTYVIFNARYGVCIYSGHSLYLFANKFSMSLHVCMSSFYM